MGGFKGRTAAQNAPRGIAGNMAELVGRFGTEEACEEHLISLRWPDGFECPGCGCRTRSRVAGRREFRCTRCGWQFSATSGTAIAHTKLPLTLWFRAAWLVARDPRGVSAAALAEELGVSDVTGASVLRRLRAAMGWSMRLLRLDGDVEADDAYAPCRRDPSGGGRGRGRAPVLVAVSPGGGCVVRAVSDLSGGTWRDFASQHVCRGASVSTDAWTGAAAGLSCGWPGLVQRPFEPEGPASLPAAHGAISLFKASLVGTFRGVSAARLQEYADEFSWKRSHRGGDLFAELLGEVCRWGHTRLADIRSAAEPQPPGGSLADPNRKRNDHRRRAILEGLRRRLISDVALLSFRKSGRLPAGVTVV